MGKASPLWRYFIKLQEQDGANKSHPAARCNACIAHLKLDLEHEDLDNLTSGKIMVHRSEAEIQAAGMFHIILLDLCSLPVQQLRRASGFRAQQRSLHDISLLVRMFPKTLMLQVSSGMKNTNSLLDYWQSSNPCLAPHKNPLPPLHFYSHLPSL